MHNNFSICNNGTIIFDFKKDSKKSNSLSSSKEFVQSIFKDSPNKGNSNLHLRKDVNYSPIKGVNSTVNKVNKNSHEEKDQNFNSIASNNMLQNLVFENSNNDIRIIIEQKNDVEEEIAGYLCELNMPVEKSIIEPIIQNPEYIEISSDSKESEEIDVINLLLTIQPEQIDEDVVNGFKENIANAKDAFEKASLLYKFAIYYERFGDYVNALVQWHLLSEDSMNGWKAFNSIGSIYFKGGEGVEKNYHEALKWFNKGASLDDDEADLNIAYTWDNLRNEATSDVKREEYRLKAIENYKRIGCFQSSSHCGSNISRFNAVFLTHLNARGAFAPKDLKAAAASYTNLHKSKSKDCRVPLMRALVEHLIIQEKRKVGGNIDDKKFKGFLESANKLGSLNAKKLLDANSLKFKKCMEIILYNPQCAYLDHNNS